MPPRGWLEFQGSAVAGGCLIETSEVAKRIGQVGVVCRYARIAGDCLADRFDRQIKTAGLVGDYTEQMEAVGMAGIDCEGLTVELFGFMQAPVQMMLYGIGK